MSTTTYNRGIALPFGSPTAGTLATVGRWMPCAEHRTAPAALVAGAQKTARTTDVEGFPPRGPAPA